MLITEAAIDKLEALMLNKIWRLDWYYFLLNFNEAKEISFYVEESRKLEFINGIQPYFEKEGYIYRYELSVESDPLEILSIVLALLRDNPGILRNVVRRIFDSNEIPNQSKSRDAKLGRFNEKNRKRRNKIYEKKIRKKFRQYDQNLVIMAEGDSWFEFPRFSFLWGLINKDVVIDILDHLIAEKNIAVYSLAAGGDWLSNMLLAGEYIDELPKILPDVLLMSGGGNDLVGNRRIATMVRSPKMEGRRKLNDKNDPDYKALNYLIHKRKSTISNFDESRYRNGLELISAEFFIFLNVATTQYFLFFQNLIKLKKYRDMLIITQGYDFVIPSLLRRKGFWRNIVNRIMDTGHWLYSPLAGKGIVDDQDLRDVMYVMITEFNEMLIELVQYSEFRNVCHIDCRGVVKDEKEDWFDELHLTSKKYKEVANMYLECIRDFSQKKNLKKVYRVAKL